MAGEIIRPSALPPRASPVATEAVPSDNGSTVGGVTWAAGVAAGRPLASQAEAVAGIEATKAMTPLTTKQAIQAQGDVRFASAAQGGKADTAIQPDDLALVAISGAYSDLTGKPILGSAAAENVSAFATASQGALADTAVQPSDLATVATTGDYNDLINKPSSGGTITPLSRVGIKALDTSQVTEAYLVEQGREGLFQWRLGNYAANIAADVDEAFFIKANAVASSAGAWVRVVGPLTTPRTAGKATTGVDNVSNNVFAGPAGVWDSRGASLLRQTWVVGTDHPASNIGTYTLGYSSNGTVGYALTGHYVDSAVDGASIIGGMPNYYSIVGPFARLSHTVGKDNHNNHISGILFSDHSDLLHDDNFNIGDHGAIIGGAFHVVTGSMAAIVGGRETQVHAMYGFMGGGDTNRIGNRANSGDSSHSAMIGGHGNYLDGRYNAVLSGLDIVVKATFSGALGGWNNKIGQNEQHAGMATVGGVNNDVRGEYGVAVGGLNNTIASTGTYAKVSGTRAVAREIASDVLASGRFAADGDGQTEVTVGFGAGTSTVTVSLGGQSSGLGLRDIQTAEVVAFSLLIVGTSTIAGEYWAYRVEGLAQRLTSPTIVAQTVTAIHESDAAFNPVVSIVGTKITLTITGNAAKPTRFVCRAEFSCVKAG